MALWIWGLILLLIIFCLSLYIKVDVNLSIREEESFQGLYLKVLSRFYKINRKFDYTDPHFRLVESILVASFLKKRNPVQTPTVAPSEYEEYLLIFKGFPIKHIVKYALEHSKIMSVVLKYLIVDRLEWKTIVGSQDALYTALGTGACWALKGTLIGVLSSRCRLGRLMLDVKPDFMTPALLSNLSCILKIRTVHIMIIGIRIIAMKVRWCINGSKSGTRTRNVQPSH